MRRFFSGSAPACAPRRALMVKRESGITTMTVGLIAGYQQAENYVASGKTDLICLARGAMWIRNGGSDCGRNCSRNERRRQAEAGQRFRAGDELGELSG